MGIFSGLGMRLGKQIGLTGPNGLFSGGGRRRGKKKGMFGGASPYEPSDLDMLGMDFPPAQYGYGIDPMTDMNMPPQFGFGRGYFRGGM